MNVSLLLACVLAAIFCVPHHMVSAIYVPPEMMPAGAPAERSSNADAQTRSLGGAARGSTKQGVPQLSAGAQVDPPVTDLPDPAAVAPAAAADPLLPLLPAAPAHPSGPQVLVVAPFGDDDDDDDDDDD